MPSLQANQVNFLFSRCVDTSDPNELSFGIADLAWVTVASSLVALVFAMPIACGIALFLTQYAPRSLARPFAYIVDLLAAVPSVIYGLWGVLVLGPVLKPVALWLNQNSAGSRSSRTATRPPTAAMNIFTAGIVLAVMILPTITGVTPRGVPADAEGAHRRCPGARRHPLGGRADDGVAVRPQRLHRRFDARPRPRALGETTWR
ncbi:hypothetical protein [Saccharopolyspora gregorii]|uniref:Uncharacterized protein n=1 Tax=Saccharopolyspora gregorii TaxID=33914 RepID=A0ABP6S354_9PSEU